MKKYKDAQGTEIEAVVYDGTPENIAAVKELTGGNPVQAEGQMLAGVPDLLIETASGQIRLTDSMAIVRDDDFIYPVEADYFKASYTLEADNA
jgi:hypothetical protein